MAIKFKRYDYVKFFVFSFLFYSFYIIFIIPLPFHKRMFEDYSRVFYSQEGKILYLQASPSGKYRIRKNMDEISPVLIKSLLAKEDKFYYFHPGFNPVSIVSAFFQNIRARRIVRGASTITMQCIRLNTDKKMNPYFRKFYEIFWSVIMELKYPKKTILEIYLNSVPMGGNLEGIEAASILYFSKSSSDLNYGESATLMAILNDPALLNIDGTEEYNFFDFLSDNAKSKDKNKTVIVKRNEILDFFLGKKWITEEEKRIYENLPLGLLPARDNPLAIHYCLAMGGEEDKYIYNTTINSLFQESVEDLLKIYTFSNHAKNGAVIVYDLINDKVLVYAGNPSYENRDALTYNGACEKRQPGSLLKPFIYASAFDHLGMTPDSIIWDVPFSFNGYEPKNFSGEFSGPVSVMLSLRTSLNVPAVYTNHLLGQNHNIAAILKTIGTSYPGRELKSDDYSAVLGSFPLSLEELCSLYSSLARKGVYKPLNLYSEKDKKNDGNKNFKPIRLFSEESVYLVSMILNQVAKPYLKNSRDYALGKIPVAYKTGTSHGGVDAWSIGYNRKYLVGVWMGNLDMSMKKGLVGVLDAAPLLFQVFDYLAHMDYSGFYWFEKPEKIKTRMICPVSGKLAGKFCPIVKESYYIEGVSNYGQCDLHYLYYYDPVTGKYFPESEVKSYKGLQRKVIVLYPDYVKDFLSQSGMDLSIYDFKSQFNLPEHMKKITIKNIDGKYPYILPKGENRLQMNFEIFENGFSKVLYWIIDGEYIASSISSEKFTYFLSMGGHKIEVYDQMGNYGFCTLTVVGKD